VCIKNRYPFSKSEMLLKSLGDIIKRSKDDTGYAMRLL
jgi:hypothetical protein